MAGSGFKVQQSAVAHGDQPGCCVDLERAGRISCRSGGIGDEGKGGGNRSTTRIKPARGKADRNPVCRVFGDQVGSGIGVGDACHRDHIIGTIDGKAERRLRRCPGSVGDLIGKDLLHRLTPDQCLRSSAGIVERIAVAAIGIEGQGAVKAVDGGGGGHRSQRPTGRQITGAGLRNRQHFGAAGCQQIGIGVIGQQVAGGGRDSRRGGSRLCQRCAGVGHRNGDRI